MGRGRHYHQHPRPNQIKTTAGQVHYRRHQVPKQTININDLMEEENGKDNSDEEQFDMLGNLEKMAKITATKSNWTCWAIWRISSKARKCRKVLQK